MTMWFSAVPWQPRKAEGEPYRCRFVGGPADGRVEVMDTLYALLYFRNDAVSPLCWAELPDDGGPVPNEVLYSRNPSASETAVEQVFRCN